MELTILGAAKEVGRAAYLLEHENKRVLLDYGIKVSPEENILPLPVQGFLDSIIVSHAHLDHSGAIPLLYKNTEQPLFMTPPSRPMIDLLVEDSMKVNKLRGLKPIFSKNHVKRMNRNTYLIPYDREHETAGITFSFHDAGHILGAASVELTVGDKKIFYTGDIKFEDTRLHKAAYDKIKQADVLITESTYGGRKHPDRKQTEKEFVEACWDICDDGGIVLIPAFAVGRSQEVISVLESSDFDYPVYMDGMSRKAAEIMMEFPEYLRDYNDFYKAMKFAEWVTSPYHRKKALEKPGVIVATAGMLTGGPAVSYLFKLKEKNIKAGVFFTGYQPEQTPGYYLLNTKRFKYEGFDLNMSNFDIKYFDFSAHSDGEELVRFAEKLNPEFTIIIHGEEEQAEALKKDLEERGLQAHIPRLGEKIILEDYLR